MRKKGVIGLLLLLLFLSGYFVSRKIVIQQHETIPMDTYRNEWNIVMEITDINSTFMREEKDEMVNQKKINRVDESFQSNTTMVENTTELKRQLDELCSTREITVAIIDTGLNYDKFEYKDRVINVQENFLLDENGHGTLMAEIIAEHSSNMVKILPIKVADKEGKATVEKVCQAIEFAMKHGADIINLSMNTLHSQTSQLLECAIDRAKERGISVVVSAGNKGVDVEHIAPANIESAMVISATASSGQFAGYSNYGDTIDYSALGEYKGYHGTSYAAAYFSAVFAEILTKGYSESFLESYLYDGGEPGWDPYFGKGAVSLTEYTSCNLIQEMFGENVKPDEKSSILEMGDFHLITNSKIDEYVGQADLADVGYYLSTLSENDLKELLERDTLLKQKVCFCEGAISNDELEKAEEIPITEAKECYYYEKCLQEYEYEARMLRISATHYQHKVGRFVLTIDDRTESGKSTVYEICTRVCIESNPLDGKNANNGKPVDRNVANIGNVPNRLTVWANPISGYSDTMRLEWGLEGGYYARFLSDENNTPGRIFEANLYVYLPPYTLMYTGPVAHAQGGRNCAGRGNFFRYTKENVSNYATNKYLFRLRKYGMRTHMVRQAIGPQINTTHMNLSDTSSNHISSATVCRMFIYLNQPQVLLKVNPNGEKWAGTSEVSSLYVVNGQTYELGTTTVTNYRATFYGGGDALDPVADCSVTTDKSFHYWSLEHFENGSGQMGAGHSYMSENTFVAGTIEYDKNSIKAETTGETVAAKAVFSGSHEITFPYPPERTGYTFAGWYSGRDSGQGSLVCDSEHAGTATMILNQDIELHAEWIKNQYKVSFYNDNQFLTTKVYAYQTNIDLSSSGQEQTSVGMNYVQNIGDNDYLRISKGEYILVGWSLTPGGAAVSSVSVPANNDLCLFAVWSRPTSGMKQVVFSITNGAQCGGQTVPTPIEGRVNTTLGLKAFFYDAVIPISITDERVYILEDGRSYAEDNAGNKTAISSNPAIAITPIRYTFVYKFYTFNARTKLWDYMENSDVFESANAFPNESIGYSFTPDKCISAPYGYSYHHAAYANIEVGLPYNITVTGMANDTQTVRTIDVFFYPISCTVTFDANGGSFVGDYEGHSVVNKSVLYGDVIGTFPGVYYNEFYSCSGFFDQRQNGKKLEMNTSVYGNMTLYAGWQPKECCVRYDAYTNQGKIEQKNYMDVSILYDNVVCFEEKVATRPNYEFIGWSKEANSMPQKELTILHQSVEPLRIRQRTMTLYAQFARTLSIRFHQWSGIVLAQRRDGSKPILYNNETSVHVISPKINGYDGWDILGWTTKNSMTEEYELGELGEINVTNDCDYYALYDRTVTVSYDTNLDFDEVMVDDFERLDTKKAYHSTSGCEDIKAVFEIKEGPGRQYYSFLYWKGNDGKKYEPGDCYASTEDLELTAIWKPETAVIVYDAGANGGTVENQAVMMHKMNYKDTIPTNAKEVRAKKDGYVFLGWSTKKNATECMKTPLMVDSQVMDDGVLTLYAIFRKSVSAYFYQQGKTKPEVVAANLFNNEEYVVVHAPKIKAYEGWDSLGWTSKKSGKSAIELCSDTDFELSEDKTYYAVFKKCVTLSYETGVRGLDVKTESGYTYHNSASSRTEYDEPASFVVAKALKENGRSFIGWEDHIGTLYLPEEELCLYENEVLTAKWDEYPKIYALDRFFTLVEATDKEQRYVNEQSLLNSDYVMATDKEDSNESLRIQLVDFEVADFKSLQGTADLMVTYSVTDSYGNKAIAYATVHVVDTSIKNDPVTKSVRFISPEYYESGDKLTDEKLGGLSSTSLWRLDKEHANCLHDAMNNVKSEHKRIRFCHVFSMEDIRKIKKNIRENGEFGKYNKKDKLDDFIKTYVNGDSE